MVLGSTSFLQVVQSTDDVVTTIGHVFIMRNGMFGINERKTGYIDGIL